MWVNLSLRAAEIKSSINKKADGGGRVMWHQKGFFLFLEKKMCRADSVSINRRLPLECTVDLFPEDVRSFQDV